MLLPSPEPADSTPASQMPRPPVSTNPPPTTCETGLAFRTSRTGSSPFLTGRGPRAIIERHPQSCVNDSLAKTPGAQASKTRACKGGMHP
jgi:hypothetical protein